MKFIRKLHTTDSSYRGCVATIGNFDGVHLGHQKIITQLKKKAESLSLPFTVISFDPLPAEFFLPTPPTRIYPMRDKVRLLADMGVNNYLSLKFDKTFSMLAPETFIADILQKQLKVKYLAVGDDFHFGYKREGNYALLKKTGKQFGMEVVDTPTYEQGGERVSSTRIRKQLEVGNIEGANNLLGSRYKLSGRVRHGDKRGRTIGFPTLNLRVVDNIALKKGVYAVLVHGLSGKILNGVANLGTRPTVYGAENRLEVHLFDFDETVYGKYICVEFIDFVRSEQKFDSFELLKDQILKDASTAKNILVEKDNTN